MYQKIKELEILVNSGNSLKLDQLSGQNRIVTQIKEGKIIYTHGVGGSKGSLNIDLLYKTYFILQKYSFTCRKSRKIQISSQ